MSSAIDPLSVTLLVEGRNYFGFQEVQITRSVERMCSTFRVKLVERWSGQEDPWQIPPFTTCVIKIGTDTVLTGYVDAYRPEFDRGSHNVEITGRSKTEDVVDCTPDLPGGQFNGYTLDAIARAIAAPFGISVVVQAPVGAAFPDATIQRHETGFQFAERLARLRSVLLADDENGNWLLTTTGAGRATDSLVQGQNIQRASAELNGAKRFSEYRVKTQVGVQTPPVTLLSINSPTPPALPPTTTHAQDLAAAASFADDNHAPQTQATTITTGIAYDPGVPRFRPHVIIAESGLSADLAQKRAVWQAKYNAARGLQYHVEVAGWRQSDGTLWRSNTLATLVSPFLQVDAQLLIVEVTQILAPAPTGRITRLTLAPVDGYQPDPGQVRVRKPRGTGGAAAVVPLISINTVPEGAS